jgi:glycosyltransferase involved in cell wall biosynthesis
MRIGIYAPYYHPFEGGAERVARRVALGLAGEHEVVVFTLQYDPDLPSEEMDGPVLVRRVPYAQTHPFGFTRTASPALLEMIGAAQLDALQLHGVTFPDLALGVARLARRRRVPTLLVTHGFYEAYFGDPRQPLPRRLLYLAAMRPLLAALVWASTHVALLSPSERALTARVRYPDARTTIVYNGFEPPDRSGASAARFRDRHGMDADSVVLHVASVKPNKGHDVVIDALPEIVARFPSVRYVAIGQLDGPWRDFAQTQLGRVGKSDLRGRAVFLGHVSDNELADAYAAAEIVLLPSLSETFPLSLLDAMAWGKPVVATDVGGIAQVVRNGENGLLIPPADQDALARSLARLLGNSEERARLGQCAAETVERYRWENVLDRYETICRHMTEGRAEKRASVG